MQPWRCPETSKRGGNDTYVHPIAKSACGALGPLCRVSSTALDRLKQAYSMAPISRATSFTALNPPWILASIFFFFFNARLLFAI